MAQRHRALPEPTGHERKRFVEHVAEPGVDVPVAGRVVGARQGVDDERDVVAQRLGRRSGRVVHAGDVAGHRVPERVEQLGEGTVEMEAVAATGRRGDALRRRDRISPDVVAEVEPERLVRDPLDVRPVQADERGR